MTALAKMQAVNSILLIDSEIMAYGVSPVKEIVKVNVLNCLNYIFKSVIMLHLAFNKSARYNANECRKGNKLSFRSMLEGGYCQNG